MMLYLFSIQAESGTAPIERILPETKTMPFCQVLNYPLARERTFQAPPQHVKPAEEMAIEAVEEAVIRRKMEILPQHQ